MVTNSDYAGMLQTVTLLKRGDDQAEGTVTSYTIFNVRRGKMFKHGEPLQGDMTVSYWTTFHIPRAELQRVGVAYLSTLDRIVENMPNANDNTTGTRTWQPEAPSRHSDKLFTDHYCVDCLLISQTNSVDPSNKINC